MSSTTGALGDRYAVVIVGSGYGGSVLAARLAETVKRPGEICLLERGLELHPGEYPDRLGEALRRIQVTSARWQLGSRSALFDFRFGPDVNVLVGCGLGGGSLINAGVSLDAPPAAFAAGWPADVDDGVLAPHYDRARAVLGANPFPRPERFAKYRALDRSVRALGSEGARAAPVNVTLPAVAPPPGPVVAQPPCTSCGDCVSGCNVGAKNTLLMNYLPLAHDAGVRMFTRTGVRAVQPGTGAADGKWLVYVDHPWGRRRRSPSQVVVADNVVLAAGTLGSTEILLRSRRLGLPASDRLGAHFSANGDVLGFAYDGRVTVDALAGGVRGVRHSVTGPCITGMAEVEWTAEDGSPSRVLLEEGAVPSLLAPLVPLAFASTAFRRGQWRLLKALAGPYRGALRRTLPYLLIHPDDDGGRLHLRADRLVVDWPGREGRPAYAAHDALLRRAAAQGLGAVPYRQPGWDGVASPLTTVHPLGGCVMADDAVEGVVNARHEVFRDTRGAAVHDGLFVCDGSVIPTALGVNPLLTIAALAERAAPIVAERLTGRGWPR